MRRAGSIVLGAWLVLGVGSAAQAQVTLNSVRVGATDTEALATFYEKAFGMHEVRRIDVPGGAEIFVNFGATPDAARANRALPVVIMHRDSDALVDPIPHIIFNVTDVAATAKAVQAAGGKMDGEPRGFGNTGIMIGFAVDPAGNRIELIQPASR